MKDPEGLTLLPLIIGPGEIPLTTVALQRECQLVVTQRATIRNTSDLHATVPIWSDNFVGDVEASTWADSNSIDPGQDCGEKDRRCERTHDGNAVEGKGWTSVFGSQGRVEPFSQGFYMRRGGNKIILPKGKAWDLEQ